MCKMLFAGLLLLTIQTRSQSVSAPVTPATLNIGGGSAFINPSFSLDWSIGESTIIETFKGENDYANAVTGIHWAVTSGILQPFDKTQLIFNPVMPQWTNQEIRIYPLPTPQTVYIDFRSVSTGKISMQLMTLGGRLIGLKEFTHVNGNSTQSWDMKNQPSGIYYLKIVLSTSDGRILKHGTFKIEKIQ